MADTTTSGATPTTPDPTHERARGRRWHYVVLGVLCAGAIVWLLFGALRENIVYLQPVSEAVAGRDAQGERKFRMGGAVVPCTITETVDGVQFVLTEGGAEVTVTHHGDPPDLFEDGAPVVVEGRWAGEHFDSERLLIRHGEEYTPETVAVDRRACTPGQEAGG
jgi:cytochrome c-type biogenesis protein CcmE